MPKNDELIKIFGELLELGNTKLQRFPLHKNKYRLKKQILYIMMAATQSYSEAIYKLMKDSPVYDKAAEVLYRSLSENLINLSYIYSSRTQINAVIFMVHSIQENNDFVKKYKKLMEKYPSWNFNFAELDTPKKCDSYISKNVEILNKIEEKYRITLPKKLPKISDRVIQYDEYLKLRGKLTESNNLESSYVLFYKFFSQMAHLTMPGLERFITVNSDGSENVVVDGDIDSVYRILAVTYQHYLTFLKFTLQSFKLYNKNELDKFNQFSKKIRGGK